MEEPDTATVVLQLKLDVRKTVGDLKADLAEEAKNIYLGNKKLDDDDASLFDVGIVPGSKITNRPLPLSENATETSEDENSTDKKVKKSASCRKLFYGTLEVNTFVKYLFGFLAVVKMPRLKEDCNGSLAMLSHAFRPALVKIMSQLDEVSFLRMTSTCRRIRDFALSKKNGISVEFPCKISRTLNGPRLKWYKEGEGNRTIRLSTLKNIVRFPFKMELWIFIRQAGLLDGGINSMAEFITSNLKSFSVAALKNTDRWHPPTVDDWRDIATFLNNFKVGTFEYRSDISREVVEILISTKINELSISAVIPLELMSTITPRHITLYTATTVEYFTYLVQEFCLGRLRNVSSFELDHYDPELNDRETFEACFSDFLFMDYDHEGELPEERPLVFTKTFTRYNFVYAGVLGVGDIVYSFTNCIMRMMHMGYPTCREEMPLALIPYMK